MIKAYETRCVLCKKRYEEEESTARIKDVYCSEECQNEMEFIYDDEIEFIEED